MTDDQRSSRSVPRTFARVALGAGGVAALAGAIFTPQVTAVAAELAATHSSVALRAPAPAAAPAAALPAVAARRTVTPDWHHKHHKHHKCHEKE